MVAMLVAIAGVPRSSSDPCCRIGECLGLAELVGEERGVGLFQGKIGLRGQECVSTNIVEGARGTRHGSGFKVKRYNSRVGAEGVR